MGGEEEETVMEEEITKDEGGGFGVGDSERENIEEVRDLAKEEAYFQSSKINKKFGGECPCIGPDEPSSSRTNLFSWFDSKLKQRN